jgi:hypothetical protein
MSYAILTKQKKGKNMEATSINLEQEQKVVDERHLKKIEQAVKQRIDSLKSFSNLDGREGMNKTAERLQQRFDAWWIGIHDRAPSDFQEIANKGY